MDPRGPVRQQLLFSGNNVRNQGPPDHGIGKQLQRVRRHVADDGDPVFTAALHQRRGGALPGLHLAGVARGLVALDEQRHMRQPVSEHRLQHRLFARGLHAAPHAAGQAEAGHRLRQLPPFGIEPRALLLRAHDAIAVQLARVAHLLQHDLGLRPDADHHFGEGRRLQHHGHAAGRRGHADDIGTQHQPRHLIGPQALRISQCVARLQQDDHGFTPGHARAAFAPELVLLQRLRIDFLRRGGPRAQRLALLDHRHTTLRQQRKHIVVVTQDALLAAVQRLHQFIDLIAHRIVADARTGHRAAQAEDHRALVVAAAGRTVDARQPGARFCQ